MSAVTVIDGPAFLTVVSDPDGEQTVISGGDGPVTVTSTAGQPGLKGDPGEIVAVPPLLYDAPNLSIDLTDIDVALAALTAADTTEALARGDGDTLLTAQISSEQDARTVADAALSDRLDTAITDRTAADTQLADDLADETARATDAESALTGAVDGETSRALAAEAALGAAISDETTRAQSAEAGLAGQVTKAAVVGTGLAPSDIGADTPTARDLAITAAVDAAVANIIGGAAADFDTFLEVYNRVANDESLISALTATVAGKQDTDPDLTAIAALDSSQAGAIVSTGGGWIRQTFAQLKSSLGLGKADVGLGNVDNTSDAGKPVSTAQQAALDVKVPTSRQVTAGTGLTGGGDLSADRAFAADFGTGAGKVTQGNDARLSDARTPTAHAASHTGGGSDQITVQGYQISNGPIPMQVWAASTLLRKWVVTVLPDGGLGYMTGANTRVTGSSFDATEKAFWTRIPGTRWTEKTRQAFGLLASSASASIAGGGNGAGSAGYWFGELFYGTDGGANGGWAIYPLAGDFSGTYSLTIYSAKTVNGGIVKHEISVDGGTTWTLLGSGVDLYAVTTTAFASPYTGIAIPAGSDVRFKITVTGKSGPTNYYWTLSGYELLRTGA